MHPGPMTVYGSLKPTSWSIHFSLASWDKGKLYESETVFLKSRGDFRS